MPPSRSSADTTSALMRTDSAMISSTTPGTRAATSLCRSESNWNRPGLLITPYLITSNRPGAIFALGQGIERGGIDQHRQRLMEAADQVLAGDQVDAGLAADGGVHLRQQRGRNLQHRNAAHEDRGQKSGHIVDDAAAECDHDARAIGAVRDHLFRHGFERRQSFVRFAAGEEQHIMRSPQVERLALMTPDILGGHDEHFSRACGGRYSGHASRMPRSTMAR